MDDLHLQTLPGTNPRTMVLFHGHGQNYQIADTRKKEGGLEATLISFNFPDHDLETRDYDPKQAAFGTIQELLPALQVLKQAVIDEGREAIDLYGYSAGGGALINVLALLNGSRYKAELEQIGIGRKERRQLLEAIQRGIVILDVPLKSVEEIIACRGPIAEFEILAENYRNNDLRPIDSLPLLEGLTLDIILHFQEPDESLSNRDDALYIKRLEKANNGGTTTVIIANEGGHAAPHPALWHFYAQRSEGKLSRQ